LLVGASLGEAATRRQGRRKDHRRPLVAHLVAAIAVSSPAKIGRALLNAAQHRRESAKSPKLGMLIE
jgi:hypothetical protein